MLDLYRLPERCIVDSLLLYCGDVRNTEINDDLRNN